MSLKARIEAVIYAAEEPVTLAQLASLFRDEALASRAARAAESSADPESPTEADLAIAPVLAPLVEELGPLASSEAASGTTATPREASFANRAGSDSGAQDSGDAEEATRDFAGEPQPVSDPVPDGPALNAESFPSDDAAGLAAKREAQTAERAVHREVRDEIRRLLDELIAGYNAAGSGLEIREVAGGYRFATRPECHDAVRAFIKTLKPPFKLSLQALETLAVIAYKQPITAPEIGEIRGVDSSGVLGSLVARKLITTAGRKQVVGRPILYKTTKEFLLRFGLKDVNELPSIEEFEKMATELADTDLADTDLAESEVAASVASSEEDLPFPQNEIEEIEEAETEPSSPGSENSPPMQEPEPKEPEPPIHVPEPEPEPAPASEPSLAQHAENFRS